MSARAAGLVTFIRSVYAPGLHFAYAAAWFLSLDGCLTLLAGNARWPLGWGTAGGVATLFLVLFFLRVADEIKDLDYDRVHNPDRPLVRGVVTVGDLFWFMGGTALLVVAINLAMSPWLLVVALADLVYGLLLLWLERVSRTIRDSMLLNLLVTYPVNVALSVYTAVYFVARAGAVSLERVALIVGAFALAFLHYELSRKTAWPHLSDRAERLYSNVLGGWGAIIAACGCAVGACGIIVWLLVERAGARALLFGWLAILPILAAAAGFTRFVTGRQTRRRLTPLAMVFLLLFYGGLMLLSLAENTIVL